MGTLMNIFGITRGAFVVVGSHAMQRKQIHVKLINSYFWFVIGVLS